MNKKHTTGLLLFTLLLTFIGVVVIGGDGMVERASATAVASVDAGVESETAAEESSEVAESEQHMIHDVLQNPRRVKPLPPEKLDSETLWLARVIYSETKRPEEMELVAWVVRNRVETGYRGKSSYQSAVLDPYQFSAFNPGGRKRAHYSSLTHDSKARGFESAVSIAYSVRHADSNYRPFSINTRHFYSEQSMVGVRHPAWANGGRKVTPQRPFDVEERRFRFFENVS